MSSNLTGSNLTQEGRKVMMRIGSLFTGYGGLDLATETVFDATTAWVADIDKGACKILAHRYPDVPNLGDITAVDWLAVEPVDIISGGSPCQDLSHAGKHAGMTDGTRSNLWVAMREAIATVRPQYVIWENVRGAYSAAADSDVEPCAGCVGDGSGVHLRALHRVLGDLASLGYDARWHGLRAADVGAPHGRFRVFVVACDATGGGGGSSWTSDREPQWPDGTSRAGKHATAVAPDLGHERAGDARGRRAGSTDSGDAAPDASGERHGCGVHTGHMGPMDGEDAGRAQKRERTREVASDRGAEAPADTTRNGRDEGWPESAGQLGGPDAAECGHVATDADSLGRKCVGRVDADAHGRGSSDVAWGDYEPAIRRWEHVLRRAAPAPTEPGRTGNPRLSPRFTEWMMGLPDGWITGVPGITRNEALKACGNGVVPQQAEAALRLMLAQDAA